MDWPAIQKKVQEKIETFGIWVSLGQYVPTSSAPWQNTVFSSLDVPALCLAPGDSSLGTTIVHSGDSSVERSFLLCPPKNYPDFDIWKYTHADFLYIRYKIQSVEILNPSGVELFYTMKVTR